MKGNNLTYCVVKYWGMLAVVLGAMACSTADIEDIATGADVEIGFGVTMSDSRSLIEEAEDMNAFKVWGWRTPLNQSISSAAFDGTTVSYDNDKGWVYSPRQYWMLNNVYDFYAFYPDTISGLTYNENGELSFSRLDVRQSGEYDSDKALDLMFANKQVEVVTTPPEKVELNFNHLLANVHFKLLKSSANRDDKIVVTSVVVGGMYCVGSMMNDEWGFHDSETSYFYILPNQELKTDEAMVFGNLLMIPQTFTEEQPVTFIVQYNYTQSGSDKTQQKYLMVNLPITQDWKKNTNITYNATLHVDKNVLFSTPIVESWGTEQMAGTIVIK